MLEKWKSLKENDMLPHYLGVAVGVILGVLAGGWITDQADANEQALPEVLTDASNTELPVE